MPKDFLNVKARDLTKPASSWNPYVLEPNSDPSTLADHGAPRGIEAIDALANIEFTNLDFTEGALA